MAATLPCDMCQAEPAALLITNTDNGDTFAVGLACQLTFHLTVAAELAGALDAAGLDEHAAVFGPLITILARHGESAPPADDVAARLPHDEVMAAAEAGLAAGDTGTDVTTAQPDPGQPATEAPADEHDQPQDGHVDQSHAGNADPAGPAGRRRGGAGR